MLAELNKYNSAILYTVIVLKRKANSRVIKLGYWRHKAHGIYSN